VPPVAAPPAPGPVLSPPGVRFTPSGVAIGPGKSVSGTSEEDFIWLKDDGTQYSAGDFFPKGWAKIDGKWHLYGKLTTKSQKIFVRTAAGVAYKKERGDVWVALNQQAMTGTWTSFFSGSN
jgi:hypothetical protein